MIWGTDVSATHFKKKFTEFIKTFKEPVVEEDETMDDFVADQPFYMQKLDEVNSINEV